MNIIKTSSPNYNERDGYKPEIIVIHCTEGQFPGDLKWLTSTISEVSAHYLIAPNGEIHQLVDESKAAWHTGLVVNPTFKGLKNGINPNKYSIGIEVSMLSTAQISENQRKSLQELIKDISNRHNIPIDRQHIIGHREIRSNKTCPGTIDIDYIIKDISKTDKETIKKQIVELLNKL